MKGYWNLPDATEATITPEGWLNTGDVGRIDEDGYFYIVDRTKDMIIRGGYNVYPREIEEVLYEHPAVAEAAVIGIPHDSLGEEVGAAVALKTGATATPEELRDYVKERVAAYKYPRQVWLVDALPKGPTGKVQKRDISAATVPDNRKDTMTMAMASKASIPAAKADELAAPLDLLLTSATKPFASRMMPDATWARFGANLAQHPGAVADRVGVLTRELGAIAAGKSPPCPGASRQTLQRPRLARESAAAPDHAGLSGRCRDRRGSPRRRTAGLARQREDAVRDGQPGGGAGADQQPAGQSAGLEGADRHRRPERGARRESFCPRHAFEASGAGDGRARRLRGG